MWSFCAPDALQDGGADQREVEWTQTALLCDPLVNGYEYELEEPADEKEGSALELEKKVKSLSLTPSSSRSTSKKPFRFRSKVRQVEDQWRDTNDIGYVVRPVDRKFFFFFSSPLLS